MSKLELTILGCTYAEVPMHMMLSIGDTHRNRIQHHTPPDDPNIYAVNLYLIVCSYSTNFNLF